MPNEHTYEEENLNRHEIQRQSDLKAALGRKRSQEIKIESQTTPKSCKIRKIKRIKKTRRTIMIRKKTEGLEKLEEEPQ